MFDILWYAVIGFVTSYLVGRLMTWSSDKKEKARAAAVEKALDTMVFVTVEAHTANDKTTFLMYTLVDDKFLLQAPTPEELLLKAKEKFPNKVIMLHGNESVSKIPAFAKLQNN
jgi:hypothetical protein